MSFSMRLRRLFLDVFLPNTFQSLQRKSLYEHCLARKRVIILQNRFRQEDNIFSVRIIPAGLLIAPHPLAWKEGDERSRQDRRRYRHMGYPGIKLDFLLSPEHIQRCVEELQSERLGEGETTHLCVMDGRGNFVSMTQSIERSFGAKVMGRDPGFIYNGYMKAFKIQSKSHPCFLRPGVRARSNAAPTIALRGDRPRAALGCTRSERLASMIFQVLLRLRTQTPFEAIKAPRLHCTPDGEVLLETARFPDEVCRELENSGLRLRPLDAWDFKMGSLQLATFGGKIITGVADPRRDGAAGGVQ